MSASSSYMPGSIPTAPWPTSLPTSHRGIPRSSIRSGLSDMASNCSSIPGFPRCAPTPVRWCATSSPDTTWTGSTWTTTSTPTPSPARPLMTRRHIGCMVKPLPPRMTGEGNERTHPVESKTSGLQNYDDLYADILLWDREGLMDYVLPQIYWNMGHKVADYTELVLWWSRHIKNAQLIVGQHVRRTMDGDQLHPKMVLAAKQTSGNSIWPGDDLWGNSYKGIAEQLHKDYWSVPALVPARPYPASMCTLSNKSTYFLKTSQVMK